MPFPTHLGKYEIRRELGKGSMGVVYEGFDPLIERSVAVKIIRPDQLGPSQSAELLARLKREAQAVGRLNHPGVVAIYDYGEDASFGGTHVAFIAMELIDGKELKHYFDNKHRFSPADIARIMGEVLSALQHAHERGVTHRDVKPSNVILLRSGAVKIADFGVARLEKSELTQAGTMIGTPMYMSPEQILGMAGVDGRSDIFSCGVMLYQFLTGEKPFTGSVTIVMQKVLNEEPPPPTQLNPALSPAWDTVVRKAMAKKPADRYQTAAALADAIRAAAAVKGDEATVVLPLHRPTGGADSAGATVGTAATPPVGSTSGSIPGMAPSTGQPSGTGAAAPAPPLAPRAPAASPAASAASADASGSAIYGASFGATSTGTVRSASQAAASAAVTAALSGRSGALGAAAKPAAPAQPHPPSAADAEATAMRPPAARAPAAASTASGRPPAAGTSTPAAAAPRSASKPLLVGAGIVGLVLVLALAGYWWTRPAESPPPVPVAATPQPAEPTPATPPVVVAPPAPAVEPAASEAVATPVPSTLPSTTPTPAPTTAAAPDTSTTPPPATTPEPAAAAEWRARVSRLEAARNPLTLPAALGLLLDLPGADDRRIAGDIESMLKSRPPHSALVMGVATDGQLRFHWQAGLPSPGRAEDAVLRRCRQLLGPNGGCAAVVVNGEFRRDAFTGVARLLGTMPVPAVRNRFLRTLDRALAEQRAKDGPPPAEAVAVAPAPPARPAPAPAPAPARPVNEWADAVSQLRAAEGQLTLARGLELLLQVKDPAELERLAQLQSAVKRMRWKSAMAMGERNGLISFGFANGERLVQWAEERAVTECAAPGGRACTVVAVDGSLRSGAFIEFAARMGGRSQAQVRETFLRDVQRSLQAGI